MLEVLAILASPVGVCAIGLTDETSVTTWQASIKHLDGPRQRISGEEKKEASGRSRSRLSMINDSPIR